MLFLGYDPGGKGTHGVAAVRVASDGSILEEPECAVCRDARDVIEWLHANADARALGIDTLLAWSLAGGRACDDLLRASYPSYGPTVIPQNALYSSMTVNGALVARAAHNLGLPLYESHPKLLIKTHAANDREAREILHLHREFKLKAGPGAREIKLADDMADALIAAWCASRAWYGRWSVDLFQVTGETLEFVSGKAVYPWPEMPPPGWKQRV